MCELMHHWFGGDPKDEVREIKRELEKLLSTQPERKTGRWIGNPETCEFMTCSACGCEFDWYSEGGVSSFDWNYCPHCGAYMGGEADETD